ncbi:MULTISPECIES: ATP-binding protein [unclassified Streptomyces]|uniref:ATP-binding protein n=2 Tax=unclassified Streptomyces TaxID=2593676 RepID=UPI001F500DBE|nr:MULTISPECIES: ATP-binding protein [Streptomyces]
MTTKPASTAGTPQLTTFRMRFTSTPRGARLARRLAAVRLDAWGIPYDTGPHDDIVLIVAELSANAVRHGRVPGRDFHFGLHFVPLSGTVRVEVTDTRGERLPERPVAPDGAGVEEAGRGLLLVSRLTGGRWGWHPRAEGPGKTVWAEYAVRTGAPTGSGPDEGAAVD